MTDVSLGVRAKRKRGRPRKDSNICSSSIHHSPENSTFIKTSEKEEPMVGSMVYGVVEGSFDAGYLISLRIGTNPTPFRGLVFQPRPPNDSRDIPVPVSFTQTAAAAHPYANQPSFVAAQQFPFLGMVEEDKDGKAAAEHMHQQQQQDDHMICQETMKDYNPDVNFFTEGKGEEATADSPNLNLDLAFQKEKQVEADQSSVYRVLENPNMGYQQALVAGNPLLLPPELMAEPLDFMANCKTAEETTNIEVQSRLVHDDGEGGGGAAPSYKLDFVLGNADQPAQSDAPSHADQS